MWKVSAEADLSSQVSIRRGEMRNISADGGGFSGFVVFFGGFGEQNEFVLYLQNGGNGSSFV